MYDRTLLHTVARDIGDYTPSDLCRRLNVARNTGWRLWHGHNAPSAPLAALVEQHYGVSARHLLHRTERPA